MAVLGTACALLVGLGGCKVIQIPTAGRQAEADWVTEGDGDGRRQSLSSVLAPPLEEIWDYNAGAGFGPGSPLIVDDRVIVATRKGEIHVIDFETGKRAGMGNFGDAIDGTPVIHDGVLFVPLEWGKRSLVAYDLVRAQRLWRHTGPHIAVGLLALDDAVVVVDDEATVTAYAPRTGEVVWDRPLGDHVTVHATPVRVRDAVVVADDHGGIVALASSDGAVRWTAAVDAPVFSSMAAGDETLYIPTTRGRFLALDAANGQERWRMAVPDTTVRFTAPAVDDDLVVFGASDGTLYALDARTGATRWSLEAEDGLSGTPLLTAGWVYVGTLGRQLLAVNRRTGTLSWEYTLKGRAKSAFAARDGYLVVLTEPRFVLLFKTTSETHAALP